MTDYLKNIKLDNKKVEAISFFAEQKEMDFSFYEFMQDTINSAVDKIYKQYVPKQVREYIERKEKSDD